MPGRASIDGAARRFLAAAAALALCAGPAAAEPVDGRRLLESCRALVAGASGRGAGDCEAYLRGVLDMNTVYRRALGDHALLCPAGDVDPRSAARALVRDLESTPERLGEPAGLLAVAALVRAYPCRAAP